MCPDACVFYGYNLRDLVDEANDWTSTAPVWLRADDDDEGCGDDADDTGNWDEEYARRKGWVEVPFPAFPPTPTYAGFGGPAFAVVMADHRAAEQRVQESDEYKAWSANRTEMHAIAKQSGVEMVTYGYGDEHHWAVQVRASVMTTTWSARLRDTTIEPDWPMQVAEFMALLELPVPADQLTGPAWWVTTSYG